MYGYAGKIGYVNLSTGSVETRQTDEQLVRQFIGGSALACRLVYDLITPQTDPLGPENPLVFMTGPLVGTSAPSSSRYAVCARSPLTGIWGEATSGGSFGPKMKMAGYDGLVITGKAERPTYILVEEGEIKLADATRLWGKDTYETQALIKEVVGDCSVACIGPAGENQVLFAAVMNDHGRAAGRCGLGAVMGSKNLKAVAVKGRKKFPLADPKTFNATTKFILEELKKATALFTQYGTLGYVDLGMYFGDVPAKYFTANVFPVEKVTGQRLREEFQVTFQPCWGCAIACGRKTRLTGKYNLTVDGPEYETAVALGPLCGCFDLATIAYAGHLCNSYGLDTISAGVTIAFAMYLLDNKAVDPEKLGFTISWGDGEGILRLLEQMAKKEGPGALLGLGVKRMAAELGVDSELAAHVKGLEVPMHDPRAFAGMALVYATGPRGACHQRADFYSLDLGVVRQECLGLKPGEDRFSIKGRVKDVVILQNVREVDNALLRCTFASLPLDVTAGLLSLATGTSWTMEELLTVGERSATLKRMLNCKLGVTRSDDRLPRILKQPYREGSNAGVVPEETEHLDEYYTLRGWDRETGRPGQEKLKYLGLDII
ncbi:aldehyde ferredoxin oxidoreductase family protein [Desulfovirgula thermocuniculi]|uniref:aldehyde ferredoxin oxidoreductase family protein n=1 Tax=Desulfovirgula thermocuniculi TaxID=348842 RepID=UPI000421DF08|nr:aldehyde ferredoxin oxidoreductase family protein [Desulfovirgula thermocuniculi]